MEAKVLMRLIALAWTCEENNREEDGGQLFVRIYIRHLILPVIGYLARSQPLTGPDNETVKGG